MHSLFCFLHPWEQLVLCMETCYNITIFWPSRLFYRKKWGTTVENVTISIVTYNNAGIIEETLQSILKFMEPQNIYIVDNQSTDATVETVKKYPGVNVIVNQSNGGFGAGHNAALPYLNSKYHVIVNPDIIVDTDVFSEMAAYFDVHPEIVLAVPQVRYTDGSVQNLPKARPSVRALAANRLPVFKKSREAYLMLNEDISEPREIGFTTGCFMFIRTAVYQKLKGFDERYFMYFEDGDLGRRAEEFGKVCILPQFYVYHKWERAGAKKLKFFIIQLKSAFKYFNRWGWKF